MFASKCFTLKQERLKIKFLLKFFLIAIIYYLKSVQVKKKILITQDNDVKTFKPFQVYLFFSDISASFKITAEEKMHVRG